MCVCVWERERDRQTDRRTDRQTDQDETNVIFVSITNHWKAEIMKDKEQEVENYSDFDIHKEAQDSDLGILSTFKGVTEKLIVERKK